MNIKRIAEAKIRNGLKRQAAVGVIGPRQVGKTTLAYDIANDYGGLYLDLENRNDRMRLQAPERFFDSNQDKLIVLDEIHRMPDIFDTLRGVIDKGRREGRRKGRFLILGSASIDLLRQSGESLAGRIAYVYLPPLTVPEIDPSSKDQDRLWLRGGFPDSYLAEDDNESFELRLDLKQTYLERDIPMFAPRMPAETLERLWTMLAHQQGTNVNNSELGRSLSISTQSVNRYIDLLVDLLLVRKLMPYYANVKKRLVKSPRVYIRDSGLVHALLNISDRNRLAGDPVFGKSWEGFVIENIIPYLPPQSRPFFYRTANGAEIDLVIEHADRSVWAIEIKYALRAKLSKGFYSACDDLKPERKFVVHSDADRFPVSDDIEAVSLRGIIEELRSRSV